jgi:heme exporter protein B
VLTRVAAGLFWVAVVFSAVLTVQRSFAVESADDSRDALRLAGLDPAGIFLGKALAVAAQLLALEALLTVGVILLYDAEVTDWPLLVGACVAATAGLAAAGTVYGVLAAGLRVRDTLLPLLLLPVVAPVLIAATQVFEVALGSDTVEISAGDWIGLLGVFAVVYTAFGILAFGPALEES